jgi:transketolase
MLLYGLLYLTGYDLSLDDLKQFRQWGSKTPGHPEYGETPDVEMTTGPLGQGFAHGIGMAITERWLAEHYNVPPEPAEGRPGYEIINHYAYPDEAAQLQVELSGELSPGWDEGLADLFPPDTAPMATRNASGKVLNTLIQRVHALTGGSADLSPSTKTTLVGYGDFGWDEHCGHNMHFGVREHAMGAIAGGMALHGGVIPYAATFLTLADYMHPPMRLAALMNLRVVYVFTHDSIGLGEDGPTHQPIEHLMNLRAVPNLTVIRPADATEFGGAYRARDR